jgi:hypothetical protein
MLAVLVLADLLAGRVSAQEPRSGCRDPHPLPTCRSYLLFEIVGAKRIQGTRISPAGCDPRFGQCDQLVFPGYLAWDIGWMTNRTITRSIGASVQIGGGGEGLRLALRARHRHWIGDSLVVDGGFGPLASPSKDTYGVTGEIGVGRAQRGTIVLGFDAARPKGQFATALHGGVRLESGPAAIVTGVMILAGVAFVRAITSSGH